MSATEAAAARDAGAALALEAEARKHEIEQAISWAARSFREFTSDDVHAWLDHQGITDLAHPNALGGAFLCAARAGIIEPTDRVIRSSRESARRRKLTVWKSKIWKGWA